VGPDEQNLQPKVLEIFKNSKSVIFYGPTDKPEDVLQMADVFCLPSHREGFGTSIIEASLLELPVICSDTYGLMETIVENETGLRHEVANVTSIFEEMEKLQINIDLRKYFGRNGRQYVLKNFSADIISEQWVKFYKEIVL
jgi:glycosyltransferase involved in cell wall biosynthesis